MIEIMFLEGIYGLCYEILLGGLNGRVYTEMLNCVYDKGAGMNCISFWLHVCDLCIFCMKRRSAETRSNPTPVSRLNR